MLSWLEVVSLQMKCHSLARLLKTKFSFQSLTEDVNRQTEREKQLQKRYSELQSDLEDLQKKRQPKEAAKISEE